jgi:hypothetical protein
MSSDFICMPSLPVTTYRQMSEWRRRGIAAENLVVSLALAIMVLLPLSEAVLRRTLHLFIPASASIVQHMVLVVGMLGGAIAARDGRLLSLSNLGENFCSGTSEDRVALVHEWRVGGH